MEYKPYAIRDVLGVESIVSVHYFQFARGYVFTGERHDFWEIVYMDRGSAEIGADGARFNLREGEVAFHKPGEFHTIWAGGSKAPDIVVVSFVSSSPAMARFEGARVAVGEQGKRLIAGIVAEAGNAWVNRLETHYEELIGRGDGPVGAAQMVKLSLEALLIRLLRSMDDAARQAPSGVRVNLAPKAPAGRKEYLDRLASDIEVYIAGHLGERMTVADLCRRFNMSGTSLKRLVRSKTGGGVREYQSALRHGAAKRLIREGLLNMTAIADACGYGSPHYFSRRFTQSEGMTPTEYARSVKSLASQDNTM